MADEADQGRTSSASQNSARVGAAKMACGLASDLHLKTTERETRMQACDASRLRSFQNHW